MPIPQDPMILFSYINTMLRDGDYDSLEQLCEEIGADVKQVTKKLNDVGFEYSPENKKFI